MKRARRTELSQTMPIAVSPGEGDEDTAGLRPLVLVMSGERVGTRCVLDAPLVVGRDPRAGLALRDAGVSWQHARFEVRDDGKVYVVDLGSKNGTHVNGDKIEPEEVLVDGDTIQVGTTVLRLEMADRVEATFHAALDDLVNLDDLTGLLARRRWEAEASLIFEAAQARKRPLALFALDIDGVKQINDTHGHRFGAHTISQAGKVIGEIAGQRGIATRIGGDEFAVMLPDMDAVTAIDVAHEIRDGIRRHVFELDGITIRPGISIGVAMLAPEIPDLAALMRRADSALYRAKSAGRDRVAT